MSTPNLAITQIAAAQAQKEVTANTAFTELDKALTNLLTVAMTDADVTLTTTEGGQALGNMVFKFTGALTAGRNIIVPVNKKLYVVQNGTTGGFALTVKTPAGAGIAVTAAMGYVWLYCDGTNVVQVTLGSALAFTNLTDVPASYTGAGGKAVEVNAGATGLQFSIKPFDIGFFAPGTYLANQIVLILSVGRACIFRANLPNSKATLAVAATASTVFSVQKNGVQFATITFAAAGTTGTFVAAVDTSFAIGDTLKVVAPAVADATAAGLSTTFVGERT